MCHCWNLWKCGQDHQYLSGSCSGMQYVYSRNEDVFNKVRTLTAVATQLKIGGVEDSRRLLRCYNWNMWKYFLDHQNLSDKCSGGIHVKLVICVVPGHWKIKILNLKKRNKFFCFFMFLYPIQGGKNIGSPYLTNKSWFFGKSDVPGQQNKSYIGVMASKNLIFLMFWLSFVYL